MGCPKCGAPVSDTDFACRRCGTSFVADPIVIAQNQAAAAMQPQYGVSQPPFNPPNPSPYDPSGNQPNPYSPPGFGNQAYGYPQVPGAGPAPTTSAEASNALLYAVIGFFCCGFIFGFIAIAKAQAARATIARNPGMPGRGTADAAFYLGLADIVLWILALFSRLFMASQHR